MALEDLIKLSKSNHRSENLIRLLSDAGVKEGLKDGMSEERVRAQLYPLRTQIAFYRQYPDLFVDMIKGPDSTFHFYFYQRVFLRIVMRHRYVYATFPRASIYGRQ